MSCNGKRRFSVCLVLALSSLNECASFGGLNHRFINTSSRNLCQFGKSSFPYQSTFLASAVNEEAISTLEKDDETKSADDYFNEGMTNHQEKNLLAAVDSFKRVIELEPEDKDLRGKVQLGKVYMDMGYVDEAEQTLRDIVSSSQDANNNPQTETAKLNLANLLIDGRGKRVEAFQMCAEACATGPSHMAVGAGIAADSLGDHAAANVYYTMGLDINDADVECMMHLMMSKIRYGGGGDDDGEEVSELRAKLPSEFVSSCDYVLSTPVSMRPSMHYFTYDMIHLGLNSVSLESGLVLEFGVFHGKTIRMIGDYFLKDESTAVHGFDTFSGIPEDWHTTPSGSYSTHGALPPAQSNVQYHVGLFSETLPTFLQENNDTPIRFMNIDCDLYSSTKDILDAVWERVVPGTIIVFDDYVMNPHWKDDEYKAFQETVAKHGWTYEYLGISLVSQQACVRILSV